MAGAKSDGGGTRGGFTRRVHCSVSRALSALPTPSSPRPSAVRAVALCVVLIGGSIAGPAAAPAAAVHDCDAADALFLAFGGAAGWSNFDKCTNNHVDQAVEDVRTAETNQTKVDIYTAGDSQRARSNNFNANYDNYLNDSESVAWMKAEAAIAEAYENGSTQAVARSEARQAISDYYATKQLNLIESWNTTSDAVIYLNDRSHQEGIYGDFVRYVIADSGESNHIKYQDVNSTTLVNGSTAYVRGLEVYDGGSYSDSDSTQDSNHVYTATPWHNPSEGTWDWKRVIIEPPTSDYSRTVVLDFQSYVDRWNRIETKNNQLQSEADAFVNATWQDYQDGNINSTEVVSRTTTMFEYGSSSMQNGTYYDMIGATASMGLDAPALNETGQMTVTTGGGNTYDGMLFARNPPNNQWEVNTTYDPSNITGPVMLATVDGQMKELTRNFTVDAATDKQGNSRQTVQTTEYSYQTSNTSQLNAKYDRLLNLTQELQNRSESVEAGAGGGASGGILAWLDNNFTVPLPAGGEVPGRIVAPGLGIGAVAAAGRAGLIGGQPPS